jgi:hypothetical protein
LEQLALKARFCVLAYRVPVAVLDNILQWMPSQELAATHWIVVSSDATGMQSLDALWSKKASIAMCIFPEAGKHFDTALFEVFCAEWPSGGASAVVLHCEGHQPLGQLSILNAVSINVLKPLAELSEQVAAEIATRARAVDVP